ncbi:MAG: FAD-binding oxidoreductase [Chloroflexi bacterium]|nr:FAD-binding oxidoreductase [Chloroflexota bacterium]
MVEQATLTSDLEAIVGTTDIAAQDELASFTVDGVTPSAAVHPENAEQVADLIRLANDRSVTIIPWGGGTEMHIGNLPSRYDVALNTVRLARMIEHEPANLTATCEAGMTIGSLQDSLAKAGQTAPFDPHVPRDATVGGLLATNASGAARHFYGTPRDFTIGMRLVTGDGLVTKAGGKVVKNVAGYDMCKLYIGSRGTLGVITEATFKLAPLPAASSDLAFRSRTARDASSFVMEIHGRGLSLRSVALLNAAAADSASRRDSKTYFLAIQFAGTTAGVKRSLNEARSLASESSLKLVPDLDSGDACASFFERGEGETIVRCSTISAETPSLMEAIEEIAPSAQIVATPLAGIVRARWTNTEVGPDSLAKVRECARRLDASLLIEDCPPDEKGRTDVFGPRPPSLPLLWQMKQQFDPGNVLSPGRYVDRI